MVTEVKEKKWYDWFKKHPVWSVIIGVVLLSILINLFSGGSDSEITGDVVNGQEEVEECVPDWDCSSWSDCTSSGSQTRTCTDLNNCGVTSGKPSETQTCEYTFSEEPEESFEELFEEFGEIIDSLFESQDENLREKDLNEMSISEKKNLCTQLCAGDDIDVPYVESVCRSDCIKIYYYTGEEGLDNYIEELQGY